MSRPNAKVSTSPNTRSAPTTCKVPPGTRSWPVASSTSVRATYPAMPRPLRGSSASWSPFSFCTNGDCQEASTRIIRLARCPSPITDQGSCGSSSLCFEAFRLEVRSCLRSSEEFDQPLGRLGGSALRADASGEQGHAAQVARQRSNQLDARKGNDLRSLSYTQFRFVLRH